LKFINPAVFICLALQFALFAAPDSRAGEPGTDLSTSPKLIAPTATPDSRANDSVIDAGMRAYHDGNYKSAATSFREAIETAPRDSSLHHWLGKSYGRIAENGNWFTALSYAGKTLKQFRKAVEFDADNYEALRDLIDYLETAPAFMGGDRPEAKDLRRRLEMLRYALEAGND
jgi:tetratricopeptide (TPR) repeat protein